MFISSLCVNLVIIRSVFAIRKTHMGAFQAAPAPSACHSRTELRAGGNGHMGRGHAGEASPYGRRPRERAWGGRGISEQGKGSRAQNRSTKEQLMLKTSDLPDLWNNQSLEYLHSFSLEVTENISRGEGQHSGINNPCFPSLGG